MNRIIRLSLVALLAVLVLPVVVRAQSEQERSDGFCERLEERRGVILSRFEQRTTAFEEAAELRAANRSERLNNHGEELVRQRSEADMLRSESLRLIREKQNTEDQKKQADQYAKEVDEAVFVRRQAFDNARRMYSNAIDSLLSERDDAARAAARVFRNSVLDTLGDAAGLCSSRSPDNNEIRKAAVRSLTAARVGYGDFLRSRADFYEEAGRAKKIRNAAYREATAEFQKSLQALRGKYQGRLDGVGL